MPERPAKIRPFSAEDLALIDRFRGAPRNPVRKTRVPNPMGLKMDRILSHLRVEQEETPERTILAHWKELLGEERFQRCAPARLQRDGTLVVLAPNPVVRQELSFDKRKLLGKIRRLPGCAFVKSILLRGG